MNAAPEPAREPLTDRQEQVLNAIRQSVEERGYPPSVREVASHLGMSTGGVAYQIGVLQEKGYIVRDGERSRALRLVHPEGNAR